MPRPPEHSGIVAALIDEELDTQKLLEKVKEGGVKASARLMNMVSRLIENAATKPGDHSGAKKALRQGFVGVVLLEYLNHVQPIATMTEENIHRQLEEIRKMGRPLREVEAIRDVDVKERASTRAGVKEPDGTSN